MYATIGKHKVPFKLPQSNDGKLTLKNWIDGVNTEELQLSIRDNHNQTVSQFNAEWTGTGWKASPVRFQVDDDVFTAWANIQPDKFGVKNRVGYTVCVKYLYHRETEKVEG